MTDPLWLRLSTFKVGHDGRALSFVARLARENRWSLPHAERVWTEYLRFIYLAATGDRAVTPSDQVDQAWHLHLCYSDSYWRELCGEIVGQKIHHGPTKGGHSENRRYWEQYEDTLTRYTEIFDEVPPVDIWPAAAVRFAPNQRLVRIDLSESFVIRKKTVRSIVGVSVGALLLTGCAEFLKEHDVNLAELLTLTFLVVMGLVMIREVWKKFRGRGGRGGKGSGGCGAMGGCGAGGDVGGGDGGGDSGCGSGCGGGGCGGGCGS